MIVGNVFDLSGVDRAGSEVFEDIARSGEVLIERIVSTGQVTPEGEWYDQERDEWVVLLSGEALVNFEGGDRVTLSAGDWLMIPAHRRHRVEYTSANPPCIWLAVHGMLTSTEPGDFHDQ